MTNIARESNHTSVSEEYIRYPMMMRSLLSILLTTTILSALQQISSVSALNWSLDSKHASCSGNPFTNIQLSATCTEECWNDGSSTTCEKSTCTLGDLAELNGSLIATTSFSNSQIVVTPCMFGICSTADSRVDGRLCDWIWPSGTISSNGDDDYRGYNGDDNIVHSCGEPGQYDINYLLQLPYESEMPNWVFNHLTINIHVDNADECDNEESGSSSYQMPIMGMGAMAVAAAAVLRERKKRSRRIEDEDDDYMEEEDEAVNDEDDDESLNEEDSYIEMGRKMWIQGMSRSRSLEENIPPVSNAVPSPVYKPPIIEKQQVDRPIANNVLPREEPSRITSHPHLETKQQTIPLEVLKSWYEQKGIAIV